MKPYKVKTKYFPDERGWFQVNWKLDEMEDYNWVQDNLSFSKAGVIRGLHLQSGDYAQNKLCTVVSGYIMDVAVNMDKNAEDYLKPHVFFLGLGEQVFIPAGYAHGFIALTETYFMYKVDQPYSPEHEVGYKYNDPAFGVDWESEQIKFLLGENRIIVSEKDLSYKFLKDRDE